MREIQVDLTLRFKMPEKGLNVNGILLSLSKASGKIFFSLLHALCSAYETYTIEKMQLENPGRYVRNGHQGKPRTLRTRFGTFQYRLSQLQDKLNGKTVVPLRQNGFFPKYRRYTQESTEAGVGLTVHLSYRRSTKEVERIRQPESSCSASTLHRRLQEFSQKMCQFPELRHIPYRFLMVDGTGVRLQGERGQDLGKGKIRWALASVEENKTFELVGFWVNESWQDIRKDLNKRLDYSRIEVLFSDGGPGIEEAFLEEGMRHQRCTLHGKRDFSYILYLDGAKKTEQAPLREKLLEIPVFQFRRQNLERLSPEDAVKVKALAEGTKRGFKEIINLLDPNKYPKARVYIENLSQNVSTFFSWWLENKVWIPLNTNAAENAISRLKNRIWSVGRRWSEKGLLNWLQVAMNKIFYPGMWNELWLQYMRINPGVELTHIELKWSWC